VQAHPTSLTPRLRYSEDTNPATSLFRSDPKYRIIWCVDLINQTALDLVIRKYRETAKWLAEWSQIVQAVTWRSIQDVRRDYPSADGVRLRSGVVITVFNVKGNNFRLLTKLDYNAQRIYVVGVLTHAEYDKNQWKDRL
jgi:mRNA interferase HigB